MASYEDVFLQAVKAGEIEIVTCVMDVVDMQDLWGKPEAFRLLHLSDQNLIESLKSDMLMRERFKQWTKSISYNDILYSAVTNGRVNATNFLLQQPLVRLPCMRETPLLSTCTDVEIAKLLISCGADPNEEDANGNSPLAMCSSTQMAEVLLLHGADANTINHQNETVLNLAAKRGSSDMMLLLMKHNATNWSSGCQGESFILELLDKHLRWLSTTGRMFPSLPSHWLRVI
jgi:hypothetical protein